MDDDPAYDIAVTRVSGTAPICEARLREVIEATLRRHPVRAARIGVALVDDRHIAELNQRYLNHRGPTDVLTFDLRDGDDGSGKGCHASVEGEIIVSVDTAAREASGRGHGVEAELALYVVHGTLHLLGYRDHDERDAARMHKVEDEILAAIGVGPVFQSGPR